MIIRINGTEYEWEASMISFEDICNLESLVPERNPSIVVAYRDTHRDRILMHGESAIVHPRMLIDAGYTGNS